MKEIFIVTGANGFLGNNIVRAIQKKYENAEIRAVVHRKSTSPSALNDLNLKLYECDVKNKDSLSEVFDVPADARVFVIHAAGIVTIKAKKDPAVYETNVIGTKNILEKTLEINAKLIYISSVHAIPVRPKGEKIVEVERFNPDIVEGLYAKTKAEAANLILDAVKEQGLNACILHPSGMIGPCDYGLTHLTKLIRDLANGDFRIMVNGGYDFVDVRDVADAVVSACEKRKSGECYILSNKFFSLRETADLVCDKMGYKKIKFTVPMCICKFFAPVCELYYNIRKIPPLFTRLSLNVVTSNGEFDNSKARNELGFNPSPFEETIEDTIAFMIKQGIVKVKTKLQIGDCVFDGIKVNEENEG